MNSTQPTSTPATAVKLTPAQQDLVNHITLHGVAMLRESAVPSWRRTCESLRTKLGYTWLSTSGWVAVTKPGPNARNVMLANIYFKINRRRIFGINSNMLTAWERRHEGLSDGDYTTPTTATTPTLAPVPTTAPSAPTVPTIHPITPGDLAFIAGAGYPNTLYHFSTIRHYHTTSNTTWETVDQAIARAIRNHHELAWANPEATVICADPGFYERERAKRATAHHLSIGDHIRMEDVVYRITPSSKPHVTLVPVTTMTTTTEVK